ncbi:asparaginase [Waterburya agarophytonicola K14]|uniref:Asparaginase n=1 Tax=Waterburya agarophytonicola KI4 TaxID=2874699 RepID=A0A964BN74_9CYAN|nr:asparaginase [Waterburya agarophytonicola]MCC0175792.1 asparaginase [Waterburya agarophytonicola KI4]
MTRGKKTHTPTLEVHLLREGIVESSHQVEATVCDSRGRVLLVAGNSETSAFIRSALKPFQALAVTSTGTLQKYDLSDRDLAIMCSSHQGNTEQARQAFNILWQADVDPNHLKCPIPPGKSTQLQHNCSGKHAGVLAVCQNRNWPLNTYLHRSNPVQKLILTKISELLGMPGEELIGAKDDCGMPTYSMELKQIAHLYAQLAAGNSLDLERIARAMTYYPRLISGEGAFDSELMRLSEGELVSKSGAEGIQCVGRIGQGMGLAIKVKDGARRAKYAVAIQVLRQMGWISPAIAEILSDNFVQLTPYKRLETIGELSIL